ncbi:hypothetical protein TASIC1_0009029600 [Trichoderma asperellum]|uniref:SnoaL-like domain-containing protein n=1 Tax=Trichoderma asperellum TaxID=101201 RepID=A0A6V8QZL9_TRIAP|nr:hypothetical protein LI328DRAFT_169520 [Trichoderma asperelloides]GFP57959.1 hypothetical protein TASIC1_0009029600 [Trichoderma asperellum]
MKSALAYLFALVGSSTKLEEPIGTAGLLLTDEYTNLVANHSASFHPNFSKNTVQGLRANIVLVTPDVDSFFSGFSGLGSAQFAQALAFPGGGIRAQFLDRLIIVEGNTAAILSPSRITTNTSQLITQTTLAETMIFDKDALLSRIVSIGEAGLSTAQQTGEIKLPSAEPITLNPIANTSAGFTFKIKEKAAQFNINFNKKNSSANGLLATEDVTVVSDGRNSTGRVALVNLFTRYNISVPDLVQHDEFVLGQGNWAVTEYIFQGTRNATFTMLNGTKVPPNGAQYRIRGMRFMRFNDAGLVDLFWQAADNDAFVSPIYLVNSIPT